MVTAAAEKHRQSDDQIVTGESIKDQFDAADFNMAGSFLLFRGLQMTAEQIRPYTLNYTFENENEDGDPLTVFVPGNASFSRDLKVSLDFAFANP